MGNYSFFFDLCVFAVAPLIGRYCGTKIPPEIQSASGLLSLSFHTDMAVAKDGFSARYNLTRKEVSDCKCETAREGIPALRVGLLAFSVLFPSLFLNFKHCHLCCHSFLPSSFDSSYPLLTCLFERSLSFGPLPPTRACFVRSGRAIFF